MAVNALTAANLSSDVPAIATTVAARAAYGDIGGPIFVADASSNLRDSYGGLIATTQTLTPAFNQNPAVAASFAAPSPVFGSATPAYIYPLTAVALTPSAFIDTAAFWYLFHACIGVSVCRQRT